ncbi:MAG: TlpA family protein disulfide reductase [Mycoplasmatales bacterium]
MKKMVTLLGVFVILFAATGCSATSSLGKYEPLVVEEGFQLCGPDGGCSLNEEVQKGYDVGNQIPNLELTDFDGKKVMLYDLVKGKKKFVLNFSTYWCDDCHREKQKMNEYYPTKPDEIDMAVVYINRPPNKERDMKPEAVKENTIKYLDENKYTFPTFYDESSKLQEDLKVYRVPFNIVLDENAIIKAKVEETDFDNLISSNNEELTIR